MHCVCFFAVFFVIRRACRHQGFNATPPISSRHQFLTGMPETGRAVGGAGPRILVGGVCGRWVRAGRQPLNPLGGWGKRVNRRAAGAWAWCPVRRATYQDQYGLWDELEVVEEGGPFTRAEGYAQA